MILPNCREDAYYNEDFLNEKDKEFIKGFDWATEMACDNFFDNHYNDISSDENSDYLDRKLAKKVPKYMQEEYEIQFVFSGRVNEARTVKTYADYIRFKILEWIEQRRDELITSMIESMDKKEYKENRHKAILEHQNKYYDTRKCFTTDKKEYVNQDCDSDYEFEEE